MGILDEDVAAVRAASDIVAIVSQTTQLRKVGAQWVGRCPFHADNSPSFSVNANTNVYYCFGCGVQGDVITYVQEREGLGFPEAVEWLAAKANISLRYTDRQQGENRRQRDRLIEVMGRAVDWYHERLLTGPDAGPARSYLRGRGLEGEVVREFKLGWAPDSWDEACKALALDEKTARDTGLGKRNSRGRLQDHFRGRILFPIADDQGRPIGFGGRILPGGERPGNQGKYQNTAETPLYTKSRVLYGLDRAKKAIVADDTVVICEGYTDVIAFHRNGVPLAVASCGTSLTDEHVKLLRRFARRFVLAFDADSAGQAAAERFYRWEQDHDLEVAVADLPPGQDPGDLAQSDPSRLAAAVEGARPFLRFRLDRLFAAADLSTPEGRARAAQKALDLVAEHPNVFVRDQYLVDVAGHCRIEPDRLRQQFEERVRAASAVPSRPGGSRGPRGRPGPGGRERSDTRRPSRGGVPSAPPGARRPPAGRPGSRPPAGIRGAPGPAPGPDEGGAWGDEGRAVPNEPMDDAPPPWAGEPGGVPAVGAGAAPGPRPDRSRPPARGAGPADRSRGGPMVEVLRHAVHHPGEVAPWLDEAVFDDPLHVALYRLLVESDTTEAARAAAPPDVADLLNRLLVEAPVSEPFEAVRLMLSQVIQRELRTLNADRADDPRDVVRQTLLLRSMLKDLHGSDRDRATEAAGRLLAWLRNGLETGDD
jgi:DNA primase